MASRRTRDGPGLAGPRATASAPSTVLVPPLIGPPLARGSIPLGALAVASVGFIQVVMKVCPALTFAPKS